ncbi:MULTISPECIES: PH domain-containing protein [Lysobacteraceae]|uniref:PH domain-containing protein n=1 Tax=Lysobacteraceae TaxID=32033 RepID=UPI00387E5589
MATAVIKVYDDRLVVGSGLYRRSIPVSDIIGTSQDQSGTSLAWRQNGIALPGFGLGWFSSRGGHRRLFVARGLTRNAILIRTSGKFDVLVGVVEPVKVLTTIAQLVSSHRE